MAMNNYRVEVLEQQVMELSIGQQEIRRDVDAMFQILKELMKAKIDEAFKELISWQGKEKLNPNFTPLSDQKARRNMENQTTFRHKVPNFEFPRFNGDNPRLWLRKCHKYFRFNSMTEYEKILMAAMHMDGPADYFYASHVEGKESIMSWGRFSEIVLERFLSVEDSNLVGQFNKLMQEGEVLEYIAKFEELMALMVRMYPSLSEEHYVKSFISGLKEEVGQLVELFDPKSLSRAIQFEARISAEMSYQRE